MCRVSLDIVALALYTSYGGVVYEPRRIRISRCVFKYCCGVEFPSILRKFAPPFISFHPGIPMYTSGGSPPLSKGPDDRPPPPYLKVRIRHCILRGGSRGRVQGVRTPPPDDLRFSNTTCILQKKKLCGLLVLKSWIRP